jgi:hypothetical protein
MKKNLLYIKKNINYLLKKKKIKDFCLINEKEIFKNLRFLKIFFFLNIYARFFFQYIESDIDFGSFFLYYNVIKNI